MRLKIIGGVLAIAVKLGFTVLIAVGFLLVLMGPVVAQGVAPPSESDYTFTRVRLKHIDLKKACSGTEKLRVHLLSGKIWDSLLKVDPDPLDPFRLVFNVNANEIQVSGRRAIVREIEQTISDIDLPLAQFKIGPQIDFHPIRVTAIFCLEHLPNVQIDHFQYDEPTQRWHSIVAGWLRPTGIMFLSSGQFVVIEDTPERLAQVEELFSLLDQPLAEDIVEGPLRSRDFVFRNTRLGFCYQTGSSVLTQTREMSLLEEILRNLMSSRGKVRFNVEFNRVTISDIPSRLDRLNEFLVDWDRIGAEAISGIRCYGPDERFR